jgi:hypothetical protein
MNFGRAENGRGIQQKGCSYTSSKCFRRPRLDTRDRQAMRRHPISPLAVLSIVFRQNASLLGCLGYGTVNSYAICWMARHCVNNNNPMVVVMVA